MKRYRWPVTALATIVCLALSSYFFASGILEEYKHRAPTQRNPEYVALSGLRNYETQGYEYLTLQPNRVLAVVYIIGTSLDTVWDDGGSGQQVTQTKAKVEEVLYGDIQAGDEVYLVQSGNSKIMYTDTIIDVPGQYKTTSTDDSGGFFQKGERLLVSLYLKKMRKGDANCGLDMDHLCAWVVEYSMRTVEEDGTLGYRKNSAFAPDADTYAYLPFKIPYAQYGTLQEIKEQIPSWVVRNIERSLQRAGRPALSTIQKQKIMQSGYKTFLNRICRLEENQIYNDKLNRWDLIDQISGVS